MEQAPDDLLTHPIHHADAHSSDIAPASASLSVDRFTEVQARKEYQEWLRRAENAVDRSYELNR